MLILSEAVDLNLSLTEESVNYLRGDATNEVVNGGTLRNRSSRFGDFLNSEPLHYSNNEFNLVFAGANDGMLHIFDALTGADILSYVPNFALEYIGELADPAYSQTHRYFVDGNTYVQDLGSGVILFGALGKGGKGYYSLNLSAAATSVNLESNAANIVNWEYPRSVSGVDSADIDG